MYLDLMECSDKWLYGCLFLVHNKAYLRAVFILIWDQLFADGLGLPFLAGDSLPLKRDLSGKDSEGQHLPPQKGAYHIILFFSHLGSNK